MATRTPFLKAQYGGYCTSEVPEPDGDLVRVGPGTPGGEYFRRFWLPVAFSEDLKDLPIRVRILGEDLVVFRDYSGRVGVLHLFCSHRGTSLEFGLVRQRGLQCCYHGWLYDIDGTILETPGEPPESTFKDRLCHGAYPAQEYTGIVFAYLGPPEKMPPLPKYDFLDLPEFPQVQRVQNFLPCNWLQIKENAMDPWHLYFLHTTMTGPQFTPDLEKVPEHTFLETPLGISYLDSRRMDGDQIWVRMADFIVPTIHQFPGGRSVREQGRDFERVRQTVWAVPVDDTHTMNMRITRFRADEPMPNDRKESFGQTAARPYEERQRQPGDYEARVSIYDGLARHSREHLGSTDRGVIMLRKFVRRGIEAVQRGDDPPGLIREPLERVPTYGHQRLVRRPPAEDAAEDRTVVREVGRQVGEDTIKATVALGSPGA
jgi:phenylpropionate dioxygenase-like ring-hydroxylating dioxygenase large terminal subunit